jgi:hypothetical protein
VVATSTQTYSAADEPIALAQFGERYRVVDLEGGWALVQLLGDPPAVQQWVPLDERVQVFGPFSY